MNPGTIVGWCVGTSLTFFIASMLPKSPTALELVLLFLAGFMQSFGGAWMGTAAWRRWKG